MNPFVTGVVIVWTLPLVGFTYLVLKYTWESWQEQKREQEQIDRLEALLNLPSAKPRRRAL